ncbi:methyltransferase, TIGR04325 family [Hyphomicrobium sp. xq]|uniref:Methyltransferase, TIGR04325 family n=2 Tax=Hyphomicrobium album TaxID=2665159 RepID=A0A6I3KNY1_9HYPH|nr:methyltransferase, TIGR04325 family [Hyphomicrobium album]
MAARLDHMAPNWQRDLSSAPGILPRPLYRYLWIEAPHCLPRLCQQWYRGSTLDPRGLAMPASYVAALKAAATPMLLGLARAPFRANETSYAAESLAEVVYRKTRALDRRSIPNMPGAERTLLAASLAAARCAARPLRVIDLGGACGVHYAVAQLLKFPLRWAVVESPAMATRAADLASDELNFFSDIRTANDWLGGVDLLFSSGTLQYMSKPIEALSLTLSLSPPVVVWTRMALVEDGRSVTKTQKSWLSENGHGSMPPGLKDGMVSYPITKLPRSDFLRAHADYELLVEFGAPSAGFIFVRRDN